MARTTKIPCEGVIYTVHEDAYGTTVETDEAAEILPEESDVTDEPDSYAQVLAELDELEDALTQAESETIRAEQIKVQEIDADEYSLPLL
jgi:hypothetical protein